MDKDHLHNQKPVTRLVKQGKEAGCECESLFILLMGDGLQPRPRGEHHLSDLWCRCFHVLLPAEHRAFLVAVKGADSQHRFRETELGDAHHDTWKSFSGFRLEWGGGVADFPGSGNFRALRRSSGFLSCPQWFLTQYQKYSKRWKKRSLLCSPKRYCRSHESKVQGAKAAFGVTQHNEEFVWSDLAGKYV